MNWNNITKGWLRVHNLSIGQCKGLNVAMVKSMCLRMPQLKELKLPSSMLSSVREREMSLELIQYLKEKQPKIILKFQEGWKSSDECPYII